MPNWKIKSGRESMVEQSICFYFPGPKALVISSIIFLGPAITDVPVSMMAEALPDL